MKGSQDGVIFCMENGIFNGNPIKFLKNLKKSKFFEKNHFLWFLFLSFESGSTHEYRPASDPKVPEALPRLNSNNKQTRTLDI